MAERKNILIILAILTIIAFSAVVVMVGSEEEIRGFFVFLIVLIVFIFLPIFLILNGWRYIKERKWYIDLSPIASITSDEEKIIIDAWAQLILGVIALIVVVGGSLIVILMTIIGK